MKITHFAMLAALPLLFLQPSQVAAGTITVFDLTDTLTFSISADIINHVTGSCTGETCTFTISPLGAAGASYSRPTNIFGPDGIISDTFVFPSASLNSPVFRSDSDTGPALVPFPAPFTSVTEDGTVLQVGQVIYRDNNNSIIETDTMFLQSDGSPEAPEPSSILMTLGGFGGLVLMNRRWLVRRRRAQQI